jgi:hypothetical protein
LTRREGLAASDRVRGEAADVNSERDFICPDLPRFGTNRQKALWSVRCATP